MTTNAAATSTILKAGKITIDLTEAKAYGDGEALKLRDKPFKFLAVLVQNKGAVLARKQILDLMYGDEEKPEPRTLDVYANNVRQELLRTTGESFLETIPKQGFAIHDTSQSDIVDERIKIQFNRSKESAEASHPPFVHPTEDVISSDAQIMRRTNNGFEIVLCTHGDFQVTFKGQKFPGIQTLGQAVWGWLLLGNEKSITMNDAVTMLGYFSKGAPIDEMTLRQDFGLVRQAMGLVGLRYSAKTLI